MVGGHPALPGSSPLVAAHFSDDQTRIFLIAFTPGGDQAQERLCSPLDLATPRSEEHCPPMLESHVTRLSPSGSALAMGCCIDHLSPVVARPRASGLSASLPALTAPAAAAPSRADEATLRAWVQRIREGDGTAFDLLYRATREDVARTLFHLVGRRADLEDLIQETYLRMLTAVKAFRGESQFRTFLYRVCANVAFSHLRWRSRRPEDVMAEPPDQIHPGPDPEGEAQRRQAARLVEAALEGLTAKKRVVFVYHDLCGMLPEEIAKAVGSSANTVRSRLHHARLEFADAMKRLLKEPVREPGGSDGRA